MNMPACLWMLSTCGQVSALPAGVPAVEALSTGPVYEQVLRSSPPIKLLYSHTPSSNVNEAASVLAGHAVHGDACIAVSPTHGLGTSPAVMLDDLLRPFSALKQRVSPHQTAGKPHPSHQRAQQWQRQHQRRCASPAVSPCGGCGRSSRSCRCASPARSPRAELPTPQPHSFSSWQQPNDLSRNGPQGLAPLKPSPEVLAATSVGADDVQFQVPAVPAGAPLAAPGATAAHQRYVAMRAILGSRNAIMASFPPPSPAPEPGGVSRCLSMVEPVKLPIAAAEAAPEAAAKAGTESAQADLSSGCGSTAGCSMECWGAGWSRARRDELQGRPCKSARSSREYDVARWVAPDGPSDGGQCSVARPAGGCLELGLPEAAGAAALMEVDDDCRGDGPGCGDAAVDMLPTPDSRQQGWTLGLAGDRRADVVAAEALGSTAHGDKGTQGGPGLEAQAEVSHAAWSELACDAVACIAMQLPPRAAQVQAMASVCRGWREAILAHAPLLRRIAFSTDPAHCLPERGASSARAACSQDTNPQNCVPQTDDLEVMATAMSRQYAAGACLLPTNANASGRGPQEHGGSIGEDVSPAGREPVVVIPRHAIRSLPRLLLAAALTSNPCALLVMAQLVECSGEQSGSLRWWRKLAQLGDTMGMFKLGMALYDGSHGLQPDPETAHMWLGRAVRSILKVDSLTAISLDSRQAQDAPGTGQAAARASATGGATRQAARVTSALGQQIASLDAARLRMLAWSSIVLGYLEFDGVAGRATWGMGDRSGAVRMFRLAEACGLAEASAVLGWLYNTGQY